MIKISTVLVLGAGASMPYGLPSGASLRDAICAGAIDKGSEFATVLRECGVGENELSRFGNAFIGSRLLLIDTFLSRRGEFERTGKLCIAYELCRKENPLSLFKIGSQEDWYSYLWGLLTSDVHSADDLGKNQIKIITFNYDRSLEHTLHEATKNTFGLNDETAMKAWRKVPIMHIYGQLGEYGYTQAFGVRQYDPRISAAAMDVASKAIRVVPETRTDDTIFDRAKACFAEANQIVFLGFGFDPLNIERLGLAGVLSTLRSQNKPVPTVFATVVDKTPAEVRLINQTLCPKSDFAPDGHGNLMALRTWSILR